MTGQIKTPYYIIHEDKLRRNLELISHVSEQSGAKIIMAFKANALWKTFGMPRECGWHGLPALQRLHTATRWYPMTTFP